MAAFHGRRAPFPPPFPAPPVLGSLPSAIKWNPLFAFYRFSTLPRSPVASPPLPASSFSFLGAGHPPATPTASPTRRPAVPPPSPASQQPPLHWPALRFARRPLEVRPRRQQWRCHHCSTPGRLCRVSRAPADVATTSPGTETPSSSPARPRCRPYFAGTPPCRAGLSIHLAGISPVDRVAVFSVAAARLSSASPSLHPNPAGVRRRRHRSSSPARSLVAPPPSSDSQWRDPRRPRLRAAAAGCPRRLLAGPGRRRRRPPVVPGHRGVHPSVKPFSSVVRVRQVCRCSPVVVFVLASASPSIAPAASRLRPRIAAEVVPSPFVSVIPGRLRRARSSLSFPRLVAWWLVALLV
ncbi:pollen-specific leucine-rich repeat extensin-like protein 2 [Oryza sativa Japonica Group]|uniref:pollen-specific leucine-rich repeat extensin-like protein 2 n=1 Tax=Oryza sativa subsp. japonica TaxID=39947 RepID=UPI00339C359B